MFSSTSFDFTVRSALVLLVGDDLSNSTIEIRPELFLIVERRRDFYCVAPLDEREIRIRSEKRW